MPGARPPIRSRPTVPNDPAVAPPEPLETAVRDAHEVPGTRPPGVRALAGPGPQVPARPRASRAVRDRRRADGPADRGGLEIGMVITDAAGRKVANLVDFRRGAANRPPESRPARPDPQGGQGRVPRDRRPPRSGPSDPGPLDLPPPLDSPRTEPVPRTDPKDLPTRGGEPEPSPPEQSGPTDAASRGGTVPQGAVGPRPWTGPSSTCFTTGPLPHESAHPRRR